MAVTLPTEPDYINAAGQPIYRLGAVHKDSRTVPGDIQLLVVHHTAGRDSRRYLVEPTDGRQVSTHYLVGAYPDTREQPRIYKYGSEEHDAMYTQGNGRIGRLAGRNPNDVAIAFEIEGPPFKSGVIEAAATLARVVLDYWNAKGKDPLLIRHLDLDPAKRDPAFDWLRFCRLVYA